MILFGIVLEALMENWQSEWLQSILFALATVWFVQRGSSESKPVEKAGLESDEAQPVGAQAHSGSPAWAQARGWRTAVLPELARARVARHLPRLLARAVWQSEFLALGTTAVFTIYLRRRGSPESKLVGAPHDATGSE